MATATRPNLTADLIAFQDEIRMDFGWTLDADLSSARALRLHPCNHPLWSETERELTLLRLQERLIGSPLTILGAAVEVEGVRKALTLGHQIIAADGAIGILSELDPSSASVAWSRVACVVSDADGEAEHLDAAARRGIPFVLHAHGDNEAAWMNLLRRYEEYDVPFILTHQTPEALGGMVNPGGFTDGDRAVCLALSLGVETTNIHLTGFRTDRIGRWTGATHPERKVRKLIWMARILGHLGVRM